jgi:hypothetical protein
MKSLLVAILLISGGFVTLPALDLRTNGSTVSTANIEVLESSARGLSLRVDLPALGAEYISTKGGDFTVLFAAECGYTSSVGEPRLPVIREFIEVPAGADVSVSITHRISETLGLAEKGFSEPVLPVQLPVAKIEGEEERVPFSMDEVLYKTDVFYPGDLVRASEVGMIRGHRLFLLEVFPASYNPARGSIEYTSSVDIRLEFDGGDPTTTRRNIERAWSLPFEQSIQKLALNGGAFSTRANPSLPIGYLVIADPSFEADLEPFIEWKRDKGYSVKLITTTETGGSKEQIKGFIQSEYDTAAIPPTFVLLVGDVYYIPVWPGTQAETDLEYVLLDGSDYLPDAYIGRFSTINTDQIQAMVDKSVSYELTEWTEGYDWAQKAYFMASDDPYGHAIAEGTHHYCMAKARSNGMICDSLFEFYGSGTPVAEAVNEGRSWVVYSGHGWMNSWGGPMFTQYDVRSLTNNDKYPLVLSFACLTGQTSYGECFMETWTRQPDAGAVVAFGASVSSYWGEDDILQRRMFDEFFDEGHTWVQGMFDESKYELFTHYGNTSTVRMYFEMYNTFGDPSLMLFTQIPERLYVDHPSAIPLGENEVTVTATDDSGPVVGALVGIRSGEVLFGCAYTDSSGQAILQFDAVDADSLRIGVTSHNLQPYRGIIMAGGACGDANADGIWTPSDGFHILNYIGSGPEPVSCWAANTNGDGELTPADAYYIFNFLGAGPDLDCQPCTFGHAPKRSFIE